MSDTLPSGEILELIKGQARLETKLDQFFSSQTAMKSEIDVLKADIGAVKSDIAEIKVQRRITKTYLSVLFAGASFVAWLAGQLADPLMKKFLGT
ncbi:hypothetical protein [Rhizobium sp. 1399]|uniref:hypothetical protein n=1 Tax=Rhizobium sp. 1399 TaxID=2817758 RepID=UPI0028578258|nr:hypothetical protein [Rhizobium sp. 1399]MDR6664040.1 hypothetical protein [Rhizobium sp. 1399]